MNTYPNLTIFLISFPSGENGLLLILWPGRYNPHGKLWQNAIFKEELEK